MQMPTILRSLLAAAALAGLLAACRPVPSAPEARTGSDLGRPALAVQALTGHMRRAGRWTSWPSPTGCPRS
jgi:hypothetical protein